MPLSPSATRELLSSLGHHPKKALGQNFLVDANIVHKSLQMAEIENNDKVVEIGPGLGTLTGALLGRGAQVWAVEQDTRLSQYLTSTMTQSHPETFHLTEGDALEFPLAGLPPEFARSAFKIVANLPYAISTPWMDRVLHGELPSQMVLMLQLEAAQRYSAAPGSKQFGSISIVLQSAFDLAPGHKVSGACFHPRPDVESFLIHLIRKSDPFIFTPPVHQLMRDCFQQRRKQISSLLRSKLRDEGKAWIAQLELEGLSGKSRPEQIPVSLWQKLEIT
jgi:16S rRNA (adenine1518-N6/adenine1519-N6)-dimethyltransferase